MTPFYWESAHGNFGDDLNLWLWDFLLPGFRDVADDILLVGVGTVLNAKLLPPSGRKLVIGSGFGYGEMPDMSGPDWDIRALRGPLTAQKLGHDPSLGIIDPAVMVTEMPEFRSIEKIGGTVFVPHWESTIGGLWPQVCDLAGIGYVDPCGEAKHVIRQIAGADLVIAESMHAAILADAFRVPWVAVSTSASINSFKWNDWARSLDLTYAPRRIALSSRAEAITKGARFWGVDYSSLAHDAPGGGGDLLLADRQTTQATGLRSLAKNLLGSPAALGLWRAARAKPQLSDGAILQARKDRLRSVLDEVRRDYF
jgi:succinoglycan biosynthesis protein ExoV